MVLRLPLGPTGRPRGGPPLPEAPQERVLASDRSSQGPAPSAPARPASAWARASASASSLALGLDFGSDFGWISAGFGFGCHSVSFCLDLVWLGLILVGFGLILTGFGLIWV